MDIIVCATSIDLFRSEAVKSVLDGLQEFYSELLQTRNDLNDVFNVHLRPMKISRSYSKHVEDIIYQANILLFYTKGELSYEKLGSLLSS